MNQIEFNNYVKEIKELLKEKHPLLDGKIVYFPFNTWLDYSYCGSYYNGVALSIKENYIISWNSANDEGICDLEDLNKYNLKCLKENLKDIIKDLKNDPSEVIEEALLYHRAEYFMSSPFIENYEIIFDINKDLKKALDE